MADWELSLREFEIFESVYRLGNISRASLELYLSRQAVSRTIRELEQALGQTLFMRTARGVAPTKVADDLYTETAALLSHYTSVARLWENERVTHRTLSFGLIGKYLTGNRIEEIAKRYTQDNPDLVFSFRYYEYPAIIDAVADGRLDCAYTVLLPAPSFFPASLSTIEVTREEMLLVASPDSPFYDLPHIEASVLSESAPIVLLTRFGIQADILKDYAGKHRVSLAEPVTTSDMFLIHEYVRQAYQPVVLEAHSARAVAASLPDVRMIPLSPALIRRSGLIFDKTRLPEKTFGRMLTYLQQQIAAPVAPPR